MCHDERCGDLGICLCPADPESTPAQIRTVSSAARIWGKSGEGVVAQIQPDGRVILGCLSAGTWSMTTIERDGRVPDWV